MKIVCQNQDIAAFSCRRAVIYSFSICDCRFGGGSDMAEVYSVVLVRGLHVEDAILVSAVLAVGFLSF